MKDGIYLLRKAKFKTFLNVFLCVRHHYCSMFVISTSKQRVQNPRLVVKMFNLLHRRRKKKKKVKKRKMMKRKESKLPKSLLPG